MNRCFVHQSTYRGERCPICEAAEDSQRLIDRALKAETEVARLRAQVEQLRKACQPAEAFLFRLVRDSGNDDTDPAKPVLAAVRQALRETE